MLRLRCHVAHHATAGVSLMRQTTCAIQSISRQRDAYASVSASALLLRPFRSSAHIHAPRPTPSHKQPKSTTQRRAPSSVPVRADGTTQPATAATGIPSRQPAADRSWLLRPFSSAVPVSLKHKLQFVLVEGCMVAASFVFGGIVAGALPLVSAALSGGDIDSLSRLVLPKHAHLPVAIAFYFLMQRAAARYLPAIMTMPMPPAAAQSTPSAGSAAGRRRFLLGAVGSLALGALVFWWKEHSRAFDVARLSPSSLGSPLQSESALDGRLRVLLQTALFGPVAEEIFVRGLLFARCVRMLGVIPASAVSAALFGLLHYDPRSPYSTDRMVGTAQAALFYGALYKFTSTLMVPTAWHVAHNSSVLCNDALGSPMHRLETLNSVFRWQHARDAAFVAADSNPYDLYSALLPKTPPPPSMWLGADGHSLHPEARRLTRAIFAALDRDSKGYLSAEEVAWAGMLQPRRHAFMNAALSVIERRVGGDEEAREQVRRRMHLPTPVQSMALPAADFFSEHQRQEAIRHIRSALSHSTSALANAATPDATDLLRHSPEPKWSDMPAQPRLPPIVVRRANPRSGAGLVNPLQRQLFDQYYTLYWRAYYEANFSAKPAADASTAAASSPAASSSLDSRCTLDRFESLIARHLVLSPWFAESWLRAMSEVLQGSHAHPTQALLEAHDQGTRQGFRGHRVRPA